MAIIWMFTHYNKYRDIVILSSSEGSRNVSGIAQRGIPRRYALSG